MRGMFVALLGLSLVGCSGLDRLVNGPTASRNVGEPSSPYNGEPERSEPYAVFQGTNKHGLKLYLVYWKGNSLDKQGLLENIVDQMNITKYEN